MFGLGFTEIIFLAILALVLIGPKQLPEVARTLGRFLNELKRTTDDMTHDFKSMATSEYRSQNKSDLEELQKKEINQGLKTEVQSELLASSVATSTTEHEVKSEQKSSGSLQKTEPS
jgi:sec-independent protein translocase protein TatB